MRTTMRRTPSIRDLSFLLPAVTKILIVAGLILGTVFMASEGSAQSSEDPPSPQLRINLLLSGGGTRAAAFAYGAMYELNRLCYEPNGNIQLKSKDDPGAPSMCPSVLDQVDRVSAVSGGSITAGYYMIHRQDGEFFRTFPTLLRNGQIVRGLILNDRPGSLLKFFRPPVLVLTSVVDTIFSVLSVPLFFLPIHFEFTPPAAMALTDGIIESDQLAKVYDNLYFNGTTLGSFTQSPMFPFDSLVPIHVSDTPKKNPELFIHATDIANGRIFTFDKDTFRCLGAETAYANFPLAGAAAASSSLPGVFAPVQLDDVLASSSPLTADHDKCALISSDRLRPPLLVDGGVSDNLGIGGLLSKVFEEKRLKPSKQRQKDLFIIVDAGTEAESNLPGLAGHLDNSFDALIKDKSDLSKLMASNLLSQFGLQTIEFRLSDVVTDPLVRRLATEFAGRQNQAESSHSNNHQKLIVNGFTSAELERKVLGDLNRSGMTSSGERIDTLIAAGRAVVRARYKELQNEWTKATKKQFSPVCEKINNFSKFYCWPNEFEQRHLASNRMGPLLQVLTDTGNAIREQATKNRMGIADRLQTNLGDILREQMEATPSAGTNTPCKRLIDSLGALVERDHKFYELMSRSTSAVGSSPSQLLLNSPSERWRTLVTNIYINDSHSCTEERITTLLSYLNQRESELADIPQYYLLQASLANLLKMTERVRYYLTMGTYKFSDNPSMQARAGLMFLIDLKDYRNGLDSLKRGYGLLKHRISMLESRKSNVEDRSTALNLLQPYNYRKQVLKQWLSFALATAPFPVPDDTRYITDGYVHEWERTHLPSIKGITFLNWPANREEIISGFQPIGCTSKDDSHNDHSHMLFHKKGNPDEPCTWLNQVVLEHPTLGSTLAEIVLATDNYFGCPTLESSSDCFTEIKEKELRKLTSMLRLQIREELAQTVGTEHAEEYARDSYEWFHKPESPKNKSVDAATEIEKAKSSTMYGFVLLVKNASLTCPARAGAITKSIQLFEEARAEMASDKKFLPVADLLLSTADSLKCLGNNH